MEQPLKTPLFLNLNRWREKVRTLAGNVFSPPYLPKNFILFYLLTSATHFAIMLMNYSPSYWHSSLTAKGIAPGRVYETSPMEWLIICVIYLSIALFCLTTFNYHWSLLGWFTAEVIHFYGMSRWLENCSFSRWSISAGAICESFDARIFWIIAAIPVGFLFATNLQPSGHRLPQKKFDRGFFGGTVFFSAAWCLLLLFGIIASAQKPTSGWIPLELDRNPPPLQHAAHAYDTKRNKLVMFGGATEYVNGQWKYKNETWEWDGKKWLNVSPPPQDSPTGRTASGMAYDEERDVIVLYGGFSKGTALCDTWEWDGEKWIGRCPPNCPGARFGHEMYYDSVRRKVVLYGGYDNKTFFNDFWEWDGYTWTKIEIESDSPGASWYALAYNPDEELAFGLLSGSPGGTWTFKDDHWKRLSVGAEPGNRGGMRLVYEPQRKIFVTFGGFSNDFSMNDTWFFDGKNWNQFTDTKFQPPVRSNTVVWYDQVRKHIMLFGGYYDDTVYNDTWELILPDK